MDHREEVHGQLVEARAEVPAFLNPADALFDAAAPTIRIDVELHSPVVGVLVGWGGDDGGKGMPRERGANSGKTVRLVPGDRIGARSRSAHVLANLNAIHDSFEVFRFVRLSRRDVRREGDSTTVSDHVDLAPESAARATQCVISGLSGSPFCPASRDALAARTELPSTHQRSQSMYPSSSSRICRASKMRSITPSRRQELNRWYTDCHGPYRSGRSRQGEPLRRIQKMPLKMSRAGRWGRPVDAGSGTNSAISAHSASVSSYRRITTPPETPPPVADSGKATPLLAFQTQPREIGLFEFNSVVTIFPSSEQQDGRATRVDERGPCAPASDRRGTGPAGA